MRQQATASSHCPQEFGRLAQSLQNTVTVAAAVAPPTHMHPGPDPMGGPPGFAARRPNAPSLPTFELPLPPSSASQKYPYAAVAATQTSQPPGSLTSVGNLLTPPSTVGGDGASTASNSSLPPYTPNGGYAWSPANQSAHPYGFQSTSNPQTFAPQPRGPYSPLNTVVRGNPTSPATTEGQMPPTYEVSLPPFPSSGPMSAPTTLPTMAAHQPESHHPQQVQQPQMMHTPVSTSAPQPSPIHAQEGFRPPPTPTYYSQQPSNTPQHSPFPYSSGPSPPQPSPLSAGPMSGRPQMSPANAGSMPPLSAPPVQSPQYNQRPFPPYPAHGPVLSNINNPNGQPMLLGGLPPGMMPGGFNSGHAANLQHMYGPPHTSQSQPHNDRPFKCDQCPQSFNRNHDLKRHKRIHLAVKPFPCGHCEKSFSRKDALKVSISCVSFADLH